MNSRSRSCGFAFLFLCLCLYRFYRLYQSTKPCCLRLQTEGAHHGTFHQLKVPGCGHRKRPQLKTPHWTDHQKIANSMTGFQKRNLKTGNKTTKVNAFFTLSHTHTHTRTHTHTHTHTHAHPHPHPHTHTHTHTHDLNKRIEAVQRTATLLAE